MVLFDHLRIYFWDDQRLRLMGSFKSPGHLKSYSSHSITHRTDPLVSLPSIFNRIQFSLGSKIQSFTSFFLYQRTTHSWQIVPACFAIIKSWALPKGCSRSREIDFFPVDRLAIKFLLGLACELSLFHVFVSNCYQRPWPWISSKPLGWCFLLAIAIGNSDLILI